MVITQVAGRKSRNNIRNQQVREPLLSRVGASQHLEYQCYVYEETEAEHDLWSTPFKGTSRTWQGHGWWHWRDHSREIGRPPHRRRHISPPRVGSQGCAEHHPR